MQLARISSGNVSCVRCQVALNQLNFPIGRPCGSCQPIFRVEARRTCCFEGSDEQEAVLFGLTVASASRPAASIATGRDGPCASSLPSFGSYRGHHASLPSYARHVQSGRPISASRHVLPIDADYATRALCTALRSYNRRRLHVTRATASALARQQAVRFSSLGKDRSALYSKLAASSFPLPSTCISLRLTLYHDSHLRPISFFRRPFRFYPFRLEMYRRPSFCTSTSLSRYPGKRTPLDTPSRVAINILKRLLFYPSLSSPYTCT
jgi:hypothetical protein